MNDTPEAAMKNEVVDEVLDIVYKYKYDDDMSDAPLYSVIHYNYGDTPAIIVFLDRSVAATYVSKLIGSYDVVNFKVQRPGGFPNDEKRPG